MWKIWWSSGGGEEKEWFDHHCDKYGHSYSTAFTTRVDTTQVWLTMPRKANPYTHTILCFCLFVCFLGDHRIQNNVPSLPANQLQIMVWLCIHSQAKAKLWNKNNRTTHYANKNQSIGIALRNCKLRIRPMLLRTRMPQYARTEECSVVTYSNAAIC